MLWTVNLMGAGSARATEAAANAERTAREKALRIGLSSSKEGRKAMALSRR
jgi:hypothetical protein